MEGSALVVTSLFVRDFRNLKSVDIRLGPGLNVVSGDNGQGKTNLLESLYVLATSRSFRTSRSADIVTVGGDTASVRGVIQQKGEEREQSVGIRHGIRVARINGKRPETFASYALATPVVAFHPAAMSLAAGPGAERRKLLDRLALYVSPSSLEDARAYQLALRSRQRTLEMRGERSSDLAGWEELMAQHGLAVMHARALATDALAPMAAEVFVSLGASAAALAIEYRPSAPVTEDAFRATLTRDRERDRARRSASVGPHRDELSLMLGSMPVRGTASQGQQRAVTLALQLAEIRVVERVRSIRPLLLLDDVSSELDAARTRSLFALLRRDERQVILTTTRPEIIDAAGLSTVLGRLDFRVAGGEVALV